MADLLLGIDIGTTATKAVLIAPDGQVAAQAAEPCNLISPEPGWAEEDPEQWWQNLGVVIPRCISRARISAEQVVGIGVSGMVPAIVLLNAECQVLRPSIQQNDAHSHQQIMRFREALDTDWIFQHTGSAITQQSIAPKILWIQEHEPEVYRSVRYLMGSYDFINHRLTGAHVLEHNWALESGMVDLLTGDWIPRVLDLGGVERGWLGEIHQPSELIGELTQAAAQHTGLVSGIPVVAGSADHIASAFSAGLKETGDLLVKLGGAGDILMVSDERKIDPRMYLDHHIISPKYIINGCMASSGSLLQWFQYQMAPGLDNRVLDAEAARIPPGSDGLIALPYFLGEKTPIHDPIARGLWIGLTLSHTRGHLYRALLEGISFGFRHHVQVFEELELRVRRVRVTNGGSRSALWRKITADILNYPLERVADHPGSSLGAAFVAGMGVGVFSDWEEIELYISIDEVAEPDPDVHSDYEELFQIYMECYEQNRPVFAALFDWCDRIN